ncbi:uncharacterized protein [Diabrotica undecimpunctata]|uniref:uncharacterized protein n=1 Tax=Diabrotica undecimpunctata TaxID=50387 RepID=UPI003B640C39
MVLQCCICKKTKYLHPDLSFHLFPNNIDDRTIWVANLGENIKVSKYSRICSTHFRLGDFQIKPSGKKFLKIGAIPVSEVDSELVLRSETSSKRLFVDTPVDNASHLNFKYNVNASGPSSIKRSKVILDRQASTNSLSDTGSVENFEMDIDPAGRSLKSHSVPVEIDRTNCITEKLYCRLCFKFVSRTQLICLGPFHDKMYPVRSADFKRNKILQSNMYIKMIHALMPEFDHDIIENPVMCSYCSVKLEKSFNFFEKCMNNQKLIKQYKASFCPNSESVTFEEIIQREDQLHLMKPGTSVLKKRPASQEAWDCSKVQDKVIKVTAPDSQDCDRPDTVCVNNINTEVEEKFDIFTSDLSNIKEEPINEHPITSNRSSEFPLQSNTEILKTETHVKTESDTSANDVNSDNCYLYCAPGNYNSCGILENTNISTDILKNEIVLKTESTSHIFISDTIVIDETGAVVRSVIPSLSKSDYPSQ